jgi:hypothetical protein
MCSKGIWVAALRVIYEAVADMTSSSQNISIKGGFRRKI